jgi:NADH dehydrogenase
VLWTAGVRAEDLSATLGAELDNAGRVKVEQDCTIPGHPEAFAIGDIALFVPEGSAQPLPGVAPVAMQQGRHVARAIERPSRASRATVPLSRQGHHGDDRPLARRSCNLAAAA